MELHEVNEQVAESIVNALKRFETEDLGSLNAANTIKEVSELYKTLTMYEIEMEKLDLEEKLESDKLKVEQQVANDKKAADEASHKTEVLGFWATVGDTFARFVLGTASSMFNAAIFQHLLNAEKETTIGSTSMKTFLKGGFKIFKNNT